MVGPVVPGTLRDDGEEKQEGEGYPGQGTLGDVTDTEDGGGAGDRGEIDE